MQENGSEQAKFSCTGLFKDFELYSEEQRETLKGFLEENDEMMILKKMSSFYQRRDWKRLVRNVTYKVKFEVMGPWVIVTAAEMKQVV